MASFLLPKTFLNCKLTKMKDYFHRGFYYFSSSPTNRKIKKTAAESLLLVYSNGTNKMRYPKV
jgi:hypothetical protein